MTGVDFSLGILIIFKDFEGQVLTDVSKLIFLECLKASNWLPHFWGKQELLKESRLWQLNALKSAK